MTIEADRDWEGLIERADALRQLAALATSQQVIFEGEETLLEGPGFAAYARLGDYLRDRLDEDHLERDREDAG